MGKKLTGKFLHFYKAVDQILWKDWDPIGVNNCMEARDEYYGYIPQIYKLLIESNTEELLNYLVWVEKDRMGLGENQKRCKKIVDLLMESKRKIGL